MDGTLRILQIGAGSMGSRRLRDLHALGSVSIALLEQREDRRQQAAAKYPQMPVFTDLHEAMKWTPQALSISTPPDHHDGYRSIAIERGLHHFCEADIWIAGAERINATARAKNIVAAPSCSLHFLPVVRELKRIVSAELGNLHAYQMALNTYMPDWHPTEGREYYARHRNTAAGREMVPFELLWLNDVFGAPLAVSGSVTHGGHLDGVVEDTWSLQLQLASGGVGQLTVLMGCPATLRQGWVFGDAGQVSFDLMSGEIRKGYRSRPSEVVQCGRIGEVLEATYEREIATFIEAIAGRASWPQSYAASATATATLAAAEASSSRQERIAIDMKLQPAFYAAV